MSEKHYDVQAVKEKLKDYLDAERDIDNQIERLEHLESRMIGLGAQVLTDMPRSPSVTNDRMTLMLSQKEELEASIREAVAEQSSTRAWVESIMRHMRNADEKAVIRMRYLDRAGWPEVQEMLFGHRVDYEEKWETYRRRTHRVHGSALYNMAKYIAESENPDMAISATS